MARIVINTLGSTGDLLPFVALGQGLKTRGHSVLFAVGEDMHKTVRGAGLEFMRCGTPMGSEIAASRPEVFDGSRPLRQIKILMREWIFPSMEQCYPDLLEACKGADALVATTIQLAAPLVCEKLGLHWITVSLCAMQFPTAYDAPMRWPSTPFKLLNRLGWALTLSLTRRMFLKDLNAMRAKLGFGPLRGAPTLEDFSPELVLLAASSLFSPPQPDWPAETRATGFWYYDGKEQADWQPTPELQAFLRAGEAPIVLSLGSMVQKDPARVVRLHVDAALELKRRIIVQRGWGNLSLEGIADSAASGRVIGADFLPHDWLFSNACAVIHHGGAGTTARALKHGCPMLVEPHGFDQPYNARCVRRLGVGEAVDSHRLTPRRLRHALQAVLQPATRERAARVGESIRREDGVASACAEIERVLGRGAAQATRAVAPNGTAQAL